MLKTLCVQCCQVYSYKFSNKFAIANLHSLVICIRYVSLYTYHVSSFRVVTKPSTEAKVYPFTLSIVNFSLLLSTNLVGGV